MTDLSHLDLGLDEIDSQLEAPVSSGPPFEFICGPAGTGKTFQAQQRAESDPTCLLAATTGIAAVNLGDGTTINALLGYFDTASLRTNYEDGYLRTRLGKLYRLGMRRILLDEVSMMDGLQLTMITRSLDELNTDLSQDGGRMGLTLIGDFAQLPPVKAPYAFESDEWDRYAQHTTTLDRIWRQEDPDFIQALRQVRCGEGLKALDYFEPHLKPETDTHFDGTLIVAKNVTVDRHNRLRLDELKGTPARFEADRSGKQRGDWKNIPDVLALKPGALVMLLANEKMNPLDPTCLDFAYVNGDLAEVVDCDVTEQQVTVTLKRNGLQYTLSPIVRYNLIPLVPGRVKELKEANQEHNVWRDRSGKAKFEITGWVSYLPVRLAWASTVHKSQGLSFDTVQVNMKDPFYQQPSMLYVALSRARTIQGLRLVGTAQQFAGRCQVNTKVREWL
jgi:ATP-dependent DNA helicase PIF1